MRRFLFWLAVAGISFWAALRALRTLDTTATSAVAQPEPPTPTREAVTPPAANPPIVPAPLAEAPPVTNLPEPEAAPSPPPVPASSIEADAPISIQAYCVRCRERREISDAHETQTANGRRAARGTCPICGASVFTLLPTKAE